jgi:hypothetical protein
MSASREKVPLGVEGMERSQSRTQGLLRSPFTSQIRKSIIVRRVSSVSTLN